MRKWTLVSIVMCVVGLLVFSIALYQRFALNNSNLSFAMPLGFGLLGCSILNFSMLAMNNKGGKRVVNSEHDERIISHFKSSLSIGFIVMILVIITILVIDQFRIELEVFESAIIIMVSGIFSAVTYFAYKFLRY
ncbi:hypothetical protein [Paenibacillus tundrae]|uniref:Uncharacterized membrane protein YidH (DUF202 family) n=1 Tax=Paenibacillus tundrae TaxID=528187 RepID=A0ABT9W6Y6_9BACL|nr:hypothetical protein [Paenibacillus tundrae]MDQ0168842.1 uncharacterized membrane protein YidH (DUF202 family) [Paenibacillus tundrae]